MKNRKELESFASLVTIARAAWRTGDVSLRRSALRELREKYQAELRFVGKPESNKSEAANA